MSGPQVASPLDGATVLVTGASRGIGAATARAVSRDGATVVLHYSSNETAARSVADSLAGPVHLVQGDMLAPDAAEIIWAEALARVGRIDVLVNNAGAWMPSRLDDASAWHSGWDQNMVLNLRAAADLCRLAILHYRGRGGGTIINVASRSAHRGDDRDHLAYGAAKAGLLALTKGIARGYGPDGVLAYAVAPGWVATDLTADELSDTDTSQWPLGEPAPPEDVAETIAFLASGRARHATGATIDITGADYVR